MFSLLSLPSPDLVLLACAVQTEAHLLGDHRIEAGMWVAHTAINRASVGWWGSLDDTLIRDFHGVAGCNQPEGWAIQAAQAAINNPDPTLGSLFVLSLDDLERLGPADVDPIKCFEDRGKGLCFYKDWAW
jgi:hypothetical protein